MGTRLSWLLGVLLLGASSTALAFDPKGECNKTFEVGGTGPAGGNSAEIDNLALTPSKLCSLDCKASNANGWAAAWDTPSTAENGTATTHTQAKLIAEVGAASSGDTANMGDGNARYTQYGLTIETFSCVATGSYKD